MEENTCVNIVSESGKYFKVEVSVIKKVSVASENMTPTVLVRRYKSRQFQNAQVLSDHTGDRSHGFLGGDKLAMRCTEWFNVQGSNSYKHGGLRSRFSLFRHKTPRTVEY